MQPFRQSTSALLALLLLLAARLDAQSFYPSSPVLGDAPSSGTLTIPSNSVSHISIQAPSIWIGTGRGLARSTTGGRQWQSFAAVAQFANPGIYAIAAKGGTLWCSTGYTKEVNDAQIQTGSGFTYSLDNGITWTAVPQPLDGLGDSVVTYGSNAVRFLPIVVNEQNVTFDVGLADRAVWVASWSSGLRSSTDRGQTWRRAVFPSKNRNSISPADSLGYYSIDPRKDNNYLVFSVLVENDSTIWAGSAGGVNRSTDGGISWTKYTTQNQTQHILSDWVIAMGAQPMSSKTRIWTTNWPAEGVNQEYGVSYTEDGGASWKNFLRGVKAYDFAFRDSVAYIATDAGLYRTDDGGRSWALSGTVVDRNTGNRITGSIFFSVGVIADTVFAGSGDGLVRTVDSPVHPFGETWDVFRSYEPLSSAGSAYAYPNPFSPRFESTRVHYRTAVNGGTVTIELFDFGMNRVRTIVKDAQRSGPGDHDELWDGRTDSGDVITNGVYFYRVTASGVEPAWGKILVLQ